MLVDRLPRASHLRAAQAGDVELYMTLGLDKKPPGKVPPPPLTEFSPDVELLAAVHDRLGEVIRAVAASSGSRRLPKPKPWPRPRTARDEVRRRKSLDNFRHLEQVITFVPESDWRASLPATPAAVTTATATTATTMQRATPGA